ncbi:sodium:pantothenate symporter [Pontibacillus halophilus JSM 076056 = DSM 19796]|uniref:Sodium:pantothenate symporter n=1 Tax=Pontibacillus halophilus JSM 076056 = DSM 19796 TaxID=1385510 RepID=A0A0A5GL99_9BACI|nr:sodium:pantothenate symporter [Pontibacillus halophilus JSM 076056 = DSM 19796]
MANREAIYGIGLAVINFLWWYGFAYGLGSKPQEEYTYIAGFPAWFFYSCIGGFILMVLLVIFVVKVLLVDVPFDDEEGGQS